MRPAIFAVILLRAAGAVSVFDDVRGAAFPAFVGLFDHRTGWAGELGMTSLQQKTSLLVEPLPKISMVNTDKNFLVLNLGLRSVRAIVFDPSGQKLAADAERVQTRTSGGEVEQDPEQWWQLATKVTNTVQDKVESSLTQYITVTSSACNLVAVDEENRPTFPSLLVSDRRSTAEAEWIQQNDALQDILSYNNFSASPSYLFPKILWIKRNQPRRFKQTAVFGSSNSYLTSKFVGKHVTDNLDAEKFYHRSENGYHAKLLDHLDLTTANLPDVVPVGTDLGKIKSDAANCMALPPNARFIITTYDALAAFWGAGAAKPGEAGNVCGTCSSLRVCADSTREIETGDSKIKVQNFEKPDVTVVGGSNSLEGGLLEWVKSAFYADDVTDGNLYDRMEHDASEIPVGARGLTFLPYLLGERAPFSDPHARGVFFGLERRHDRSDMVRSVFESIGFLTKQMVEAVQEAGVPINQLKVAGGLTQRRLACQIKADVTGKPVALVDEMENTALGCMLIMANTVDRKQSLTSLAEEIVEQKKIFEPDPKKNEYYESHYSVFQKIYSDNKKNFIKIERMRNMANKNRKNYSLKL